MSCSKLVLAFQALTLTGLANAGLVSPGAEWNFIQAAPYARSQSAAFATPINSNANVNFISVGGSDGTDVAQTDVLAVDVFGNTAWTPLSSSTAPHLVSVVGPSTSPLNFWSGDGVSDASYCPSLLCNSIGVSHGGVVVNTSDNSPSNILRSYSVSGDNLNINAFANAVPASSDSYTVNGGLAHVRTPFETGLGYIAKFGGITDGNLSSTLQVASIPPPNGDVSTWGTGSNPLSWVTIDPATQVQGAPVARHSHSFVADTARGVAYLFGGVGNNGPLSDFWKLSRRSFVNVAAGADASISSTAFNISSAQTASFAVDGDWAAVHDGIPMSPELISAGADPNQGIYGPINKGVFDINGRRLPIHSCAISAPVSIDAIQSLTIDLATPQTMSYITLVGDATSDFDLLAMTGVIIGTSNTPGGYQAAVTANDFNQCYRDVSNTGLMYTPSYATTESELPSGITDIVSGRGSLTVPCSTAARFVIVVLPPAADANNVRRLSLCETMVWQPRTWQWSSMYGTQDRALPGPRPVTEGPSTVYDELLDLSSSAVYSSGGTMTSGAAKRVVDGVVRPGEITNAQWITPGVFDSGLLGRAPIPGFRGVDPGGCFEAAPAGGLNFSFVSIDLGVPRVITQLTIYPLLTTAAGVQNFGVQLSNGPVGSVLGSGSAASNCTLPPIPNQAFGNSTVAAFAANCGSSTQAFRYVTVFNTGPLALCEVRARAAVRAPAARLAAAVTIARDTLFLTGGQAAAFGAGEPAGALWALPLAAPRAQWRLLHAADAAAAPGFAPLSLIPRLYYATLAAVEDALVLFGGQSSGAAAPSNPAEVIVPPIDLLLAGNAHTTGITAVYNLPTCDFPTKTEGVAALACAAGDRVCGFRCEAGYIPVAAARSVSPFDVLNDQAMQLTSCGLDGVWSVPAPLCRPEPSSEGSEVVSAGLLTVLDFAVQAVAAAPDARVRTRLAHASLPSSLTVTGSSGSVIASDGAVLRFPSALSTFPALLAGSNSLNLTLAAGQSLLPNLGPRMVFSAPGSWLSPSGSLLEVGLPMPLNGSSPVGAATLVLPLPEQIAAAELTNQPSPWAAEALVHVMQPGTSVFLAVHDSEGTPTAQFPSGVPRVGISLTANADPTSVFTVAAFQRVNGALLQDTSSVVRAGVSQRGVTYTPLVGPVAEGSLYLRLERAYNFSDPFADAAQFHRGFQLLVKTDPGDFWAPVAFVDDSFLGPVQQAMLGLTVSTTPSAFSGTTGASGPGSSSNSRPAPGSLIGAPVPAAAIDFVAAFFTAHAGSAVLRLRNQNNRFAVQPALGLPSLALALPAPGPARTLQAGVPLSLPAPLSQLLPPTEALHPAFPVSVPLKAVLEVQWAADAHSPFEVQFESPAIAPELLPAAKSTSLPPLRNLMLLNISGAPLVLASSTRPSPFQPASALDLLSDNERTLGVGQLASTKCPVFSTSSNTYLSLALPAPAFISHARLYHARSAFDDPVASGEIEAQAFAITRTSSSSSQGAGLYGIHPPRQSFSFSTISPFGAVAQRVKFSPSSGLGYMQLCELELWGIANCFDRSEYLKMPGFAGSELIPSPSDIVNNVTLPVVPIVNPSVACSNGTVNEACTRTCAAGFVLAGGSATSTCAAPPFYNAPAPVCMRACPALSLPPAAHCARTVFADDFVADNNEVYLLSGSNENNLLRRYAPALTNWDASLGFGAWSVDLNANRLVHSMPVGASSLPGGGLSSSLFTPAASQTLFITDQRVLAVDRRQQGATVTASVLARVLSPGGEAGFVLQAQTDDAFLVVAVNPSLGVAEVRLQTPYYARGTAVHALAARAALAPAAAAQCARGCVLSLVDSPSTQTLSLSVDGEGALSLPYSALARSGLFTSSGLELRTAFGASSTPAAPLYLGLFASADAEFESLQVTRPCDRQNTFPLPVHGGSAADSLRAVRIEDAVHGEAVHVSCPPGQYLTSAPTPTGAAVPIDGDISCGFDTYTFQSKWSAGPVLQCVQPPTPTVLELGFLPAPTLYESIVVALNGTSADMVCPTVTVTGAALDLSTSAAIRSYVASAERPDGSVPLFCAISGGFPPLATAQLILTPVAADPILQGGSGVITVPALRAPLAPARPMPILAASCGDGASTGGYSPTVPQYHTCSLAVAQSVALDMDAVSTSPAVGKGLPVVVRQPLPAITTVMRLGTFGWDTLTTFAGDSAPAVPMMLELNGSSSIRLQLRGSNFGASPKLTIGLPGQHILAISPQQISVHAPGATGAPVYRISAESPIECSTMQPLNECVEFTVPSTLFSAPFSAGTNPCPLGFYNPPGSSSCYALVSDVLEAPASAATSSAASVASSFPLNPATQSLLNRGLNSARLDFDQSVSGVCKRAHPQARGATFRTASEAQFVVAQRCGAGLRDRGYLDARGSFSRDFLSVDGSAVNGYSAAASAQISWSSQNAAGVSINTGAAIFTGLTTRNSSVWVSDASHERIRSTPVSVSTLQVTVDPATGLPNGFEPLWAGGDAPLLYSASQMLICGSASDAADLLLNAPLNAYLAVSGAGSTLSASGAAQWTANGANAVPSAPIEPLACVSAAMLTPGPVLACCEVPAPVIRNTANLKQLTARSANNTLSSVVPPPDVITPTSEFSAFAINVVNGDAASNSLPVKLEPPQLNALQISGGPQFELNVTARQGPASGGFIMQLFGLRLDLEPLAPTQTHPYMQDTGSTEVFLGVSPSNYAGSSPLLAAIAASVRLGKPSAALIALAGDDVWVSPDGSVWFWRQLLNVTAVQVNSVTVVVPPGTGSDLPVRVRVGGTYSNVLGGLSGQRTLQYVSGTQGLSYFAPSWLPAATMANTTTLALNETELYQTGVVDADNALRATIFQGTSDMALDGSFNTNNRPYISTPTVLSIYGSNFGPSPVAAFLTANSSFYLAVDSGLFAVAAAALPEAQQSAIAALNPGVRSNPHRYAQMLALGPRPASCVYLTWVYADQGAAAAVGAGAGLPAGSPCSCSAGDDFFGEGEISPLNILNWTDSNIRVRVPQTAATRKLGLCVNGYTADLSESTVTVQNETSSQTVTGTLEDAVYVVPPTPVLRSASWADSGASIVVQGSMLPAPMAPYNAYRHIRPFAAPNGALIFNAPLDATYAFGFPTSFVYVSVGGSRCYLPSNYQTNITTMLGRVPPVPANYTSCTQSHSIVNFGRIRVATSPFTGQRNLTISVVEPVNPQMLAKVIYNGTEFPGPNYDYGFFGVVRRATNIIALEPLNPRLTGADPNPRLVMVSNFRDTVSIYNQRVRRDPLVPITMRGSSLPTPTATMDDEGNPVIPISEPATDIFIRIDGTVNGLNVTKLAVSSGTSTVGSLYALFPAAELTVGYKTVQVIFDDSTAGEEPVAIQLTPFSSSALLIGCDMGLYGLTGYPCRVCPDSGVICLGYSPLTNSETIPVSMPGWDFTPANIQAGCPSSHYLDLYGACAQPCEPAEACPGGNMPTNPGEGLCSEGYVSVAPRYRCGDCAPGFHKLGSLCVRCPDAPAAVLVFVILAGIVGCAIAYTLSRKVNSLPTPASAASVLLSGIDAFQIFAVIGTLRLSYPVHVRDYLSAFSAFNLNVELMGPECVFNEMDVPGRVAFSLILPACILVIFFSFHVVTVIYKLATKRKSDKAHLTRHAAPLLNTTLYLLCFVYLFVTQAVATTVDCVPTEPSDGNLYIRGTLERCDDDSIMSSLHKMAIVSLILYVIGIPLTAWLLLTRYRAVVTEDQLLRTYGSGSTRLTNPRAYNTRRALGALYSRYVPTAIYWQVWTLIRKVLIIALYLVFKETPTSQAAAILLVLVFSLILQITRKPLLGVENRLAVIRAHLLAMSAEASDPNASKIAFSDTALRSALVDVDTRVRARLQKSGISSGSIRSEWGAAGGLGGSVGKASSSLAQGQLNLKLWDRLASSAGAGGGVGGGWRALFSRPLDPSGKRTWLWTFIVLLSPNNIESLNILATLLIALLALLLESMQEQTRASALEGVSSLILAVLSLTVCIWLIAICFHMLCPDPLLDPDQYAIGLKWPQLLQFWKVSVLPAGLVTKFPALGRLQARLGCVKDKAPEADSEVQRVPNPLAAAKESQEEVTAVVAVNEDGSPQKSDASRPGFSVTSSLSIPKDATEQVPNPLAALSQPDAAPVKDAPASAKASVVEELPPSYIALTEPRTAVAEAADRERAQMILSAREALQETLVNCPIIPPNQVEWGAMRANTAMLMDELQKLQAALVAQKAGFGSVLGPNGVNAGNIVARNPMLVNGPGARAVPKGIPGTSIRASIKVPSILGRNTSIPAAGEAPAFSPPLPPSLPPSLPPTKASPLAVPGTPLVVPSTPVAVPTIPPASGTSPRVSLSSAGSTASLSSLADSRRASTVVPPPAPPARTSNAFAAPPSTPFPPPPMPSVLGMLNSAVESMEEQSPQLPSEVVNEPETQPSAPAEPTLDDFNAALQSFNAQQSTEVDITGGDEENDATSPVVDY